MDPHKKITVYTPDSGIRKPGVLLKDMVRDLVNSYELGWRFFLRNVRGMYRQSLLGLFWAFIPPIMTTLVWVFLNGQRIINIDNPGVPYPAFVLTSTLLWSLFARGVIMPNQVMTTGKSIMKKINFPKESLVISGLLEIGLDFLIKSILIIAVFIVFKVVPSYTVFLVPLGVLMLVLMGMTIGLLLLPVGMLYTDIQRLLAAILPFWMLLTPVIYPAPREGIATIINTYNPVSPILTTTRDWLFYGNSETVISFLVYSAGVLVLFILGMVLFRLAIPFIIERSGG
jgi:lipopolysaccharide transport system permease protein